MPVAGRDGASSTVQLDSQAVPARVEVRTFADVDARTGVPTGDPEIPDCRTRAAQGTACVAQRAGDTVTISLPVGVGPYVVVYVARARAPVPLLPGPRRPAAR